MLQLVAKTSSRLNGGIVILLFLLVTSWRCVLNEIATFKFCKNIKYILFKLESDIPFCLKLLKKWQIGIGALSFHKILCSSACQMFCHALICRHNEVCSIFGTKPWPSSGYKEKSNWDCICVLYCGTWEPSPMADDQSSSFIFFHESVLIFSLNSRSSSTSPILRSEKQTKLPQQCLTHIPGQQVIPHVGPERQDTCDNVLMLFGPEDWIRHNQKRNKWRIMFVWIQLCQNNMMCFLTISFQHLSVQWWMASLI
jgi:hypothetical protein